jgi:cytochrome c peroxidase
VNSAARRGKTLPREGRLHNKAKCDKCHEGINFTTNAYDNLGVGMDRPNPDAGRCAVTKNLQDWGAFKKGGKPNMNLDSEIKPLHLTAQNLSDWSTF